jgi:hypothetical protein
MNNLYSTNITLSTLIETGRKLTQQSTIKKLPQTLKEETSINELIEIGKKFLKSQEEKNLGEK